MRDVWKGRVWDAVPVTVVGHDDEWLIEYQAPGTVSVGKDVPKAEKLDALESGVWKVKETVADAPGLNFHRAGGWSRIALEWSLGFDTFVKWYVNLQRPLVATPTGFDTRDLVLDIVIAPDCSWRWKDEADFAEAVRRGIFDDDLEAVLRDEGERVIRMLEARAGPFEARWQEWRPPPEWAVPVLPAGYDLV